VKQTTRQGLGQPPDGHDDPPKTKPHRFGFRPGIDLDKIGHLVDELEVVEFGATYERNLGAKQRGDRCVR